jgi:dihydrodipicolinate synthase/N-acetylneuraminate lyase
MYVLPRAQDAEEVVAEARRRAEELKVDAVMLAQPYYEKGKTVEVLKLPMDVN